MDSANKLLATLLCALAFTAGAQTFNCTVVCNVGTDAFPLPPSPQPTQCRLYDGAALLVTSLVVPSGPGVACRFSQTFAEGRVVSLTAKGVYNTGDSAASFPPLVFTSSAGPPPPPPNPTITGFVATPSTITAGASSVLSATVANATATKIDGAPVSLPVTVTPPATHVYTLTASGPTGTTPATAQTTVTVTTGPPPTTITIGDTTLYSGGDCCNPNLLMAQIATLSQPATLISLSFYAGSAVGNLRLGVYDASGPNGGPGVKKAETASFAPVVGWNTKPTLTSPALVPGTYWLAFLPSASGLTFRKIDIATPALYSKFYTVPFGPLPTTFSTAPQVTSSHYSFYATLSVGSLVLPPPTNVRLSP